MEAVIIISFFSVSILGVLTHFFHKWIRKGLLVHIFSAINESVWEHMKLAFYPMSLMMLVHALIPGFYYEGYWGTAFITVMAATMLIPILYYPIRAMVGREIPAISISLYFVCILIAFVIEYQLLSNSIFIIDHDLALVLILIIFSLFAIFTYFPPRLEMFRDPIYRKYGEFKQPFDKKK